MPLILLATLPGCERNGVARTPVRSAAAIREVPLQIRGEVVAPQLITKVEPTLPAREKRKTRQQPLMFFELVVDRTGSVTGIRTLKSNDDSLVPYVVPAIRQWKFRPATLRGKPVTVFYYISFRYEVR